MLSAYPLLFRAVKSCGSFFNIFSYRKTGRIDDALELCNRILEKNPDELIVLYHKLRLLKKSNKITESNEICNKILKKYPYNTDVQNELIK